MQSLMDDMDELYRRAADEYTLNTDSGDWDVISGKLKDAGSKPPEKKKNYRFLWLLLLLPLGIVIGNYFLILNPKHTDTAPEHPSNKEPKNSAIDMGSNQTITTGITPSNLVVRKYQPKSKNYKSKAGLHNILNNNKTERSLKTAKKTPLKTFITVDEPSTNDKDSSVSNENEKTGKSSLVDNRFTPKPIIPGNDKTGNSSPVDNLPVTRALSAEILQPDLNSMEQQGTINENVTLADTNGLSNILIADDQPEIITPRADLKKPAEGKAKESKQLVKIPAGKRWSYSLVAGPDFSLVKNKPTSKAGYSIGLMAGYKLNKKITVQAGILWDKKNYYADGKHLDTSKLKLPSHSKVLSVEGNCSMFEIPVQIQYNFITTERSAWFASAGLSSYLMKSEAYDISYKRYNQPYYKDYSYANSTQNWFSILTINAGYRRMIANSSAIEIVPYYKIPMKGIGIGNLPVSSAGVYFIFTRFSR